MPLLNENPHSLDPATVFLNSLRRFALRWIVPFDPSEPWSVRRIFILCLWLYMLYQVYRGVRFIANALWKRHVLISNGWLLPNQYYSLLQGHLPLFRRYGSLSRATLYMRNHPPVEPKPFPRSYAIAFSPLMTTLVTIDPDVIQYLLTKRNYPKAPYKSLDPLLGTTGLLTSEGEIWSHKRRIFNNGFKMDFLRSSSTEIMEDYSRQMVKYLLDPKALSRQDFDKIETLRYLPKEFNGDISTIEKLDPNGWMKHCQQVTTTIPPPEAIDFLELFSKVALDIIGQAGFGHLFGFTKGALGQSVKEMVHICLTEPAERIRNPIRSWTHRKETKLFNSYYKSFMQMGRDIVTQCRLREAKEAGSEVNKKQAGSILDLMVRMGLESDADRLSDQELLDEVMTFLIAGHETTANTMGFALLMLLNHPQYLQLAKEEVDRVMGDSQDVPNFEQQASMKFLGAVMKETLRLYPIAPASFRIITKENPNASIKEQELTVDGKKVPEGTPVLIPYMALHRDEQLWGKDAGDFRPERWMLNDDAVVEVQNDPRPFSEPVQPPPKHSHAFIPFSAGARTCIGKVFAEIEFKILMATLLRRFDLKLWRDPRGDPKGVKNMRSNDKDKLMDDEQLKKLWLEWDSIDKELLPYSEGITLRPSECFVFVTPRN